MNSHTADETGLDNYERNHWFRGKMVTARDLDAEWAYHATRQNRLTRLTVGEGIVCGLETTVTQTDPTTLSVDIKPGIGIDSVGRHVVVRRTATEEVTVDQTQARVSLYLTYRECGKESVPAFDGIGACDDDRCEYNRILETFELHATETPPGEAYYAVEPLSFPPQDAFPEGFESIARYRSGESDDDNENGNGNGNEDGGPTPPEAMMPVYQPLSRLARSYNSTDGDASGALRDCRSMDGPFDTVEDGTERLDQPAVFIGTFAEGETSWARDESVPLRFVATNDMLHDALVDHAAQFDNPHQVSLARDVPDDGVNRGQVFAADEAAPDPVSLVSSTGDIYFQRTGQKALNLTVPDLVDIKRRLIALEAKPDLPALRRYVFDKTMKYKLESFRDAAEEFEGRLAGDIAADIVAHTQNGVDQKLYSTAANFRSYLFDETITTVTPQRVDASLAGGILTLTEPDPDDANAQLTYEVDLSTQEFEAPTIAGGRATLSTSIYGLETLFVELVDGVVPEDAIQRYREALAEFRDAPKPGDQVWPTEAADAAPLVLELAVLQDQLCEAVDEFVEEDEPPTIDPRPVGNVFRGQQGVDLSRFRAAPDSGQTRLFDVSDSSDPGVNVPEVQNATFSRDEFPPGSYGFEATRTTTSVVVTEPEISDLRLRSRGQDVTNNPISAGSNAPVMVSASFNFSSVEGLSVTVTNDETNEDVTDSMTDTPSLGRPGEQVALNVGAASEGRYTVEVAGRSMFSQTTRSASFSVVDASISLTFTPPTVASDNVTIGTFTSSIEDHVFVMIPRDQYVEDFFQRNPRELSQLLSRLLFGDAIERPQLSDDYFFAQLNLRDGTASFRLRTTGLRTQIIRNTSHDVYISSDPDISFPPDQRAILATATVTIRGRRLEPFDPTDPRDPTRPFGFDIATELDDTVDADSLGSSGPSDSTGLGIFEPRESRFELRESVQPRRTSAGDEGDVDPVAILDDIRGIGGARARKLADAGVTDLSILAETDSERLAEVADVTVEMAESWRAEARDRIGE